MRPVSDAMAVSIASRVGAGSATSRVTVPVASSVSVSAPQRIVASYSFGSPSTYGRTRVARPVSSTSSPVAKGSRVPACPMRFSPSARRATLTTSWEVMPAGLSTRSSASIGRVPGIRCILFRVFPRFLGQLDALALHLREQRLDARSALDARIVPELELGGEAQRERPGETRAQMRREAREPFERGALLLLGAHDAHEHLRVPQIVRHLDTSDGNEADDARILCAFGEKGRYLDANGFCHALGTSVIVSHRSLGENPATRTGNRFARAYRSGYALEGACDLVGAVALDHIADLEVVEVLDADTALEAFTDLLHVILEATERSDRPSVHLDPIAYDANLAGAIDHAAANVASGNDADARHLEELAHFRLAQHDFLLVWTQQPFECGANLCHRLVDDPVELDLDAIALGRRARIVVRAHMEADDDGARRFRELDVALGNRTDSAMDDLDAHFARRQLAEGIGECFRRSTLIRLDHEPERLHLACRRL